MSARALVPSMVLAIGQSALRAHPRRLAARRHSLALRASAQPLSSASKQQFDPVDYQSKRWVVFSDLHVAVRTADVCLSVLRKVCEQARANEAGVIFLGDFWHARGALPVEPLNAVLQEIRRWDFPTIMLVGNHDQVDLGGVVHSLTPLEVASRWVRVVSEPQVLQGALWLPYRRNPEELQAAIREAGPLRAIFAHADVKGAQMNAAHQASEGFDPSIFPGGLPIYTGHYHLPHTVPSTSIRYVGSPYQVSRSEEGQQKALLLLDSDYNVLKTIPLDLGPRYYSVAPSEDMAAALRGLREQTLQSGDRLRLTVPQPLMEEDVAAEYEQLVAAGVDVEVVVEQAVAAPRIQEAEALDPRALLQQYAEQRQLQDEVLAAARQLLTEVEADDVGLTPPGVVLKLKQLSLSGYGPFTGEVAYQLEGRGLRVVTGRNMDDPGAESNGAGKTALVMAALWALTGKTWPRAEVASLKALRIADVVSDSCTAASVRVEGEVGGQPFIVTRAVRKGRGSLKFELGGEERTLQEMKLTQALMDEALGLELLPRCVFFSQTDVVSLLEAGDKEFKEELGRVVETRVWAEAADLASERMRAEAAERESSAREAAMLTQRADSRRREADEAQQRADGWGVQQDARMAELEQLLSHAEASARQHVQQGCRLVACLDATVEELQVQLDSIPAAPANAVDNDALRGGEMEAQVAAVAASLQAQQSTAQQLEQQWHAAQQQLQRLSSEAGVQRGMLNAAEARLSAYAQLRTSVVQPQGSSPPTPPAPQTASFGWRPPAPQPPLSWQPMNLASSTTTSGIGSDSSNRQSALPPAPAPGPLQGRPHMSTIAGQRASGGGLSRATGGLPGRGPSPFRRSPSPRRMARGVVAAAGGGGGAGATGGTGHVHDFSGGRLVCETCLQEVGEEAYQGNLSSLQEARDAAYNSWQAAASQVAAAQQQVDAAAATLSAGRRTLEGLQRDLRAAQQAQQQAQRERAAAAQQLLRKRAELEQLQQQARQAVAFAQAPLQSLLQSTPVQGAEDTMGASEGPVASAQVGAACQQLAREVQAAQRDGATAQQLLQQLAGAQQQTNPHSATAQLLQEQARVEEVAAAEAQQRANEAAQRASVLQQVMKVFGREGIPSFVLEGALAQLQALAADLLQQLSPGMRLLLRPVREVETPAKRRGRKKAAAADAAAERAAEGTGAAEEVVREVITKVVEVQLGPGKWTERSIGQLSGGERRRVGLALALAYSQLAAARGRLRCNVLVLDEVLQQVDAEGCSRAASVLKGLPVESVLLVAQMRSFATQELDLVDVVVKRDGCSTIQAAA